MEATRRPRLAIGILAVALGAGARASAAPPDDSAKEPTTASPKKDDAKDATKGAAKPAKDAKTPVKDAKAPAAKDAKAPATDDDDPLAEDAAQATSAPKESAPTSAPGPKSGPSVLLLPLQAIYRSVPLSKIQLANDLLAKELNQKETFIVIRGGVAKGEDKAPAASLDAASKSEEAADKAEADRDIQKAIELRKKTIEEMEKSAALVDPDDYVIAHHHLARALMWSGQDKEATEVLEAAARMRPAISLDPAQFSRLYRRWFQKAGEKVLQEKPSDLMVRSALPGAQITLDGRAMDVAPVLLKKVVPGKHLVGATIAGVPPFAAVVDVKPGKANDFTVTFSNTMGGSAVGIVADAISQNALPKKAIESAAQAGREAGAAFVIAGGLAKDEDHFRVHTFVVDVAKAQVVPLEVVDFDLELLTAESDVLKIVQNASNTVASFANGETAVAAIEKRIRAQNTVNEVAAAPSVSADDGAKKRDGDAPKKERKVFKPLKGTKVEIKDEEEE